MQIVRLRWLILLIELGVVRATAQNTSFLSGRITSEGKPMASATISINRQSMVSDSNGTYRLGNLKTGIYLIHVSNVGYETIVHKLAIPEGRQVIADFNLEPVPGILNEVIVTGVTKATLIRQNPAAVAYVSSRSIDKTIESNIIDALVKNVPGLNAVKTGPNISKPFIRGLGYNRVLTLFDGMRQEGQQWGDEHGIEVDAYNIAKAEVMKGPASLMFGSDAVAGVVSLLPYLPTEKDGKIHGRILSEYQSNNGLIGNGMRLGSSNTHWLWTVKGSYRLAKNYTNIIDGPVYNTGFKEANAAATIGYISQKGSTILNGTLYDNLQGIPDGSRDSLTRQFTKQVYEGSLDDIRNRPDVPEAYLNSYELSPLHQHIQHYRIYTNNHYRLSKGEIDFLLGFQQNIRREYNHPTDPDQAGLFVRLNTLNYRIGYSTPCFSNIEITVGANGMYQNNKSMNATDFPIPDYHLMDMGTFIFGKWIHRKLIVSGGIRYDTRQLDGGDFYTGINAVSGFAKRVYLPDTAGAMLQFAALDKFFKGISFSFGASYQLTQEISLKLNLARGYRAPNITEIASNGLDPGAHIIYLGNRSFVPEFNLQEDIGISGDFQSMTFSLSIFNNSVQHYIYLSQLADAANNPILDAQGNKTFQYEQASAQLCGAEASLNIHPSDWRGFGFNNIFALTYGVNKKNSFKNKGTDGEYLPLIPPAHWLSSVSQEIGTHSSLVPSVTIKAEMEYNGAQNRFLALYHTETATPSYTLINISAVTRLNYSGMNEIQLQFQVNNLLDIAYQNNLSRLKYFEYYSASPDGHSGIYNMGRNICIKMIMNF
jgi:iron complex outermembrane recepter protein